MRARREIELDDGDRLVAHELAGQSGVLALLFHGLSGDADADYMRGAAQQLSARGHAVWAVEHRGCGAGRGLARRPYHSGRSADIAAVVRAARAAFPASIVVAVGFSISGNIVLLHAGQRLAPQADAVLAVHPPIDLAQAAHDLHSGLNRLYELRFVTRLRRAARELELLGTVRARGALRRRASIAEFDDCFTAPVSGFASAAEYYERCSAAPHLSAIETPTVILSSLDDPLVRAETLRATPRSPATLLHLEQAGGHMAYLSRDGRWLERALVHYVEALAHHVRGQRAP